VTFVEGNLLSFLQLLEANSFEVTHVKKDVGSRTSVDESEPLFRQLLDRAFSHSQLPYVCKNSAGNNLETIFLTPAAEIVTTPFDDSESVTGNSCSLPGP
jgi:hypothetical protein